MMKAWVLPRQGPIERRPLRLVDVPEPHPGPHEVRVQVTVCGLCRTDIHIAEGDLPLHAKPVIPGHEIVGVVDEVGPEVRAVRVGARVGATWLGRTCGACRHCRAGRENYCAAFQATGWDLDGGLAELAVVHEDSAFPLPDVGMPDEETAPLLCPGVAGYCAFKLARVDPGDRIGLYGFGPTAFYVLKVARHLGHEVYVSSRSEGNLERARQHGAAWADNAAERGMPVELDGAVVFPTGGHLVERALADVKVGGVVVLAPVAMSPITIRDYSVTLWGRDLRTLYNINRSDSREFLNLVGRMDLTMGTEVFPFEECQQAMVLAKQGRLTRPNAVVRVVPASPEGSTRGRSEEELLETVGRWPEGW
jgi:propanol-preferring alcohol dehydrogenase